VGKAAVVAADVVHGSTTVAGSGGKAAVVAADVVHGSTTVAGSGGKAGASPLPCVCTTTRMGQGTGWSRR